MTNKNRNLPDLVEALASDWVCSDAELVQTIERLIGLLETSDSVKKVFELAKEQWEYEKASV